MSGGAEEVLSPDKEQQQEEEMCGNKRRSVGHIQLKLKKPKQHRWLLKRSRNLAYNDNVRNRKKEYETALRHCVESYKYIYLVKYNDFSSTNLGFGIFQQVLWPSSRFVLDCWDNITKAVLGKSAKDELKPGIHQLSMLVPYEEDIGFCFSNLPKWKLVREIANYEEFYVPHGSNYDRLTVIFRKGYLMAGDAKVLHENLKKLGLEKYVEFQDGEETFVEGITENGVVNVLNSIITHEASLKEIHYEGHHTEFMDEGMPSSFRPALLGCWNKDTGGLEIYDDTSCTNVLKSRIKKAK